MENTKIQWATHTFNPWRGCDKVSPGCKNCYAEAQDARFRGDGPGRWGKGVPRQRTTDANWRLPLKWNATAAVTGERPRVFCASLGDWLDDEVPAEWLADLLTLIAQTPNLDWLLLTKRPENWLSRMQAAGACRWQPATHAPDGWLAGNPPANVWVGTSTEDQAHLNLRMPRLLAIPAQVRFLSVEPQLGPLNLDHYLGLEHGYTWADCLCAEIDLGDRPCLTCDARLNLGARSGLHWVIVGGESGADARPWNERWGLSLIEQCRHAGIACFIKQTGKIYHVSNGFLLRAPDGKGGDQTFWPAAMRVRQFPEAR